LFRSFFKSSNITHTFDITIQGLTPPAQDVLQLRVTSDFAVRWPGYPSRHFAFAPDWVFAFEAGHGSGVARLTLNDSSPVVASVVDPSALCGSDAKADSTGCLKVAPANPSISGATTWLLQPATPGYVQVVVEDTNQLGVAPAATDVSFVKCKVIWETDWPSQSNLSRLVSI